MRTLTLSAILLASSALATDDVRLIIEAGNAFQSKNTAAIPGNATKFSYKDILGKGPFGFGRLTVWFRPEEKTGYRLVIAPLTIEGTGTNDKLLNFNGQSFAPGATKGSYQFNSYRFTWWRRWAKTDRLTVRGGLTVKVRDAKISLEQPGTKSSFSNLGPVPLIHIDADYKLTDKLDLLFDFDGLISTQGSALDGAIYVAYPVSKGASLIVGARMLDGGFSNKRGYNFANIQYLSTGLMIRF